MTVNLTPRWWDRFWFADGSPYDLAAARIVVSLQALWILLSRDMAVLSGVPPEIWDRVPRSLLWRYGVVPGHPALEQALYWVTIVALVAVVLGLVPRISCLAAALLVYHLGPFEAIAWGIDPAERGLDLAILALVVLAVTPCTRVWSIRPDPRTPAAPDPAYRWPILLLQAFLASVYVFAAYGRLRNSGLAWYTASNIREWLWFMNVLPGAGRFEHVGPWLASLPGVPLAIAISTIVLELGFPLALVSRTARRIIIPAALGFHLGIAVAMNLVFPNTALLLVFLNWDWLRGRLGRLRGGATAPATAVAL